MFQCLAVLVAAATVSLAATPQGFQPAAQSSLMVAYNGMDATSGKQIAKEGMTQSVSSTVMNTTAGTMKAFALEMPMAVQAAAAPYFGPSPPARTPLSHRYTQVLIDTSSASQETTTTLMQAAQNRMGFNTERVLTQAGLQDKVVAGNFFVVTNSGPARDVTGQAEPTGSMSMGTGTGLGSSTNHSPITTGTGVSRKTSGALLAVALVSAAFL